MEVVVIIAVGTLVVAAVINALRESVGPKPTIDRSDTVSSTTQVAAGTDAQQSNLDRSAISKATPDPESVARTEDEVEANIGDQLDEAAGALRAVLVEPEPVTIYRSVRENDRSILQVVWHPSIDESESLILLSVTGGRACCTIPSSELKLARKALLVATQGLRQVILDATTGKMEAPDGASLLGKFGNYQLNTINFEGQWRVRIVNLGEEESGVLLEASELADVAELLGGFRPEKPGDSIHVTKEDGTSARNSATPSARRVTSVDSVSRGQEHSDDLSLANSIDKRPQKPAAFHLPTFFASWLILGGLSAAYISSKSSGAGSSLDVVTSFLITGPFWGALLGLVVGLIRRSAVKD